ncbi:hypothetical protein L484_009710 [Morus notabilis]|uniref:Uncharacterized protein n=1 Tax=Morus notabilis TaxID=981085 RepID=W9SDV5_9ROSA|nr:hypothetical protein L484_009710 [Morus notabilis]
MVSCGRMVEMGMDTAHAVIFHSKFKKNHWRPHRRVVTKGEKVRHGLWVFIEVTQDRRPNMRCLGEGELEPTKSNTDEIRVRTSWLEVSRSRSGKI